MLAAIALVRCAPYRRQLVEPRLNAPGTEQGALHKLHKHVHVSE